MQARQRLELLALLPAWLEEIYAAAVEVTSSKKVGPTPGGAAALPAAGGADQEAAAGSVRSTGGRCQRPLRSRQMQGAELGGPLTCCSALAGAC